ncbi:hypothetical protein EON65_56110 [archaeon]|nr:MAG: hypothetical protein EON65_56110 [archaeon]
MLLFASYNGLALASSFTELLGENITSVEKHQLHNNIHEGSDVMVHKVNELKDYYEKMGQIISTMHSQTN